MGNVEQPQRHAGDRGGRENALLGSVMSDLLMVFPTHHHLCIICCFFFKSAEATSGQHHCFLLVFSSPLLAIYVLCSYSSI